MDLIKPISDGEVLECSTETIESRTLCHTPQTYTEMSENQKVQRHIEQLENDLQLAAKFGQQLLANNQDLSDQLEKTSNDFTSRIEALEQEKYSVLLRLDQKAQECKDITDELDFLKSSFESQRQDFQMREQNEHATVVNELKKQVARLQSELEASTLLSTQLDKKYQETKEHVANLQTEINTVKDRANETCSEEMAQLYSEITNLSADKQALTTEMSDVTQELERLRLSLTQVQTAVSEREAEVEEQQCQATGYFNALEKSREEVQELKVQLDLLRMESQDRNKKGNSLFGELEDRRVEAETRMISLRVQNETLKKQNDMNKDHLNKLKSQMARLLQMSTGRADTQHIQHLQQQLADARNQVSDLTDKLLQSNKSETAIEGIASWQKLLEQHGTENYSNFVKALLQTKDEEIGKLKKDMGTLRFQEMGRTQEAMRFEKKCYELQREKERLIGTSMKLQLRIEELQIKYEPEKQKAVKKMTYRAEKLPPREQPKEDKENEPKKAPPSPLEVPAHMKGKMRTEVIKPTQPSRSVTTGTDTADVSQLLPKQRTVKSFSELQNERKPRKTVSISSEVDVHEIEVAEETTGTEEDIAEGPKRTVKGSKMNVGKVIQVGKGARPANGEECKVQ